MKRNRRCIASVALCTVMFVSACTGMHQKHVGKTLEIADNNKSCMAFTAVCQQKFSHWSFASRSENLGSGRYRIHGTAARNSSDIYQRMRNLYGTFALVQNRKVVDIVNVPLRGKLKSLEFDLAFDSNYRPDRIFLIDLQGTLTE